MAEVNGDGASMTYELLPGDGSARVVKLDGELDITTIDGLEEAVKPIIDADPERLVVDVSGLRFADSSAIALWVKWSSAVRELEIRYLIAAAATGDRFDGPRPDAGGDAMREKRSFPERPESVTAARRFATEVLQGAPAEIIATVELLVSELANCIRHTDSAFDLTIAKTTREIRVEATDYDVGEPTMRSPKPTETNGRGLRIVDALASAWGVEHRPSHGKTVWFTIAVQAPDRATQLAS